MTASGQKATRSRLMASANPAPAEPILAIDAARQAYQASGDALARTFGHSLKLVLAAVLIALFVRVFLVQPFSIPSRSMAPLLEAGDFVAVDKTAYGWSRAALPFQPDKSLLPGEPFLGIDIPIVEDFLAAIPERFAPARPAAGDVVVFMGPEATTGARVDYVKRIIARGGDRIGMERGRAILNGRVLPCEPVGDGLCRETLPDGASHVVHETGRGRLADFAEVRVPDGHYFMLGDNRDDSADSRLSPAQGGVGLVPDAMIVGRARHIFFSLGSDGVRWHRIGQAAH